MSGRASGRKQENAKPREARGELSSSLEDYLETIHRLERELGEVRASDIAERLGVKRPPVTRAIQSLRTEGYVYHEARREVRLTELGRKMAAALSHRHADIAYLLEEVLGVSAEVAEADACQLEHGMSAETAQKLHEFLEHYMKLSEEVRGRLRPGKAAAAFDHLPGGKSAGWRA